MKARVPLHGRMGGVLVDTKATRGATVGVNLFWSDGSLVQVSDFSAVAANTVSSSGVVSSTLWSLVAEIPVNVQAVAALSTDGFVRKAGDTWSAAPPAAGEVAYDNTGSGIAAVDVQGAIDILAASGIITRTVQSVAVNTTANVGGDFVYLLSAGADLTLPTAVGNTGLYSVKNTDTGNTSDVIANGSETFDGAAGPITLTAPDALTFVSDGANWEII
jgi:hypothetical protein